MKEPMTEFQKGILAAAIVFIGGFIVYLGYSYNVRITTNTYLI